MFTLAPRGEVLELLCFGAHSDDIEIGCGGTVLELLDRHPASVTWVVWTSDEARGEEARSSAADFLAGAQEQRVLTFDFEESVLPLQQGDLRRAFQALRAEVSPDLVLTHYRDDRHQDHRTVSELTWQTFRRELILEYEIPKWDGDLGVPNTFVPLSEASALGKLDLLMRHFGSQQSKPWYDRDTFLGLMRLRGMECRAASRFAEAFHGRKLVIS